MFTLLFGASVFALVTAAAEQIKMAQNALLSYFTWNYVSVHLSAWICAYEIKKTLSFSLIVLVCDERNARLPKLPEMSSGNPTAVQPLRSHWGINGKLPPRASTGWLLTVAQAVGGSMCCLLGILTACVCPHFWHWTHFCLFEGFGKSTNGKCTITWHGNSLCGTQMWRAACSRDSVYS